MRKYLVVGAAVVAAVFVLVVIVVRLGEKSQKAQPKLPKYVLGKGVWIQYLSQCEGGNVDRILQRAVENQLDYILVKVNDGSTWYRWCPKQKLAEALKKFHAAGLKILGWGFVYGDDPTEEANRAIEALRLGCDGYVWDVEGQFSHKRQAAKILCSRVHKWVQPKRPWKILGYSTFCRVDKQPDSKIPYDIFGRYCDVVMPQCYWATFNWNPEHTVFHMFRVWADMQYRWSNSGKADSIKPIIPTGHAYIDTAKTDYISPEEVTRFLQAVEGYYGVNIWRWELMDKQHWQALRVGPGGRREKAKNFAFVSEPHRSRSPRLLLFAFWLIGCLATAGWLEYQFAQQIFRKDRLIQLVLAAVWPLIVGLMLVAWLRQRQPLPPWR